MYIGALDIGGTKTIAAVLNEKGQILGQENFTSLVSDYEAHMQLCVSSLKRVMEDLGISVRDLAGLGVTLPGIADIENGILIYAPYSGWKNKEIASYLRLHLAIENVCCENDVNACAVGELVFGLGKTYKDFVWMTVSTGVGGAVVNNGKLLRGGQGNAGELGHLKVEYNDPASCPCGQKGCLEAHGSGTALIRETEKAAGESVSFAAALKDAGLKPDGAGCAALARSGNPEAGEIMDRIGTYLGRGISYCVNILDPQAVIIGGGVARSLDLLLPPIRRTIRETTHRNMQNVEVLETALGYEAALMGAAALVLVNSPDKGGRK